MKGSYFLNHFSNFFRHQFSGISRVSDWTIILSLLFLYSTLVNITFSWYAWA